MWTPLVRAVRLAKYARDPLLWVRSDYGGPTMPLDQALKELAPERGGQGGGGAIVDFPTPGDKRKTGASGVYPSPRHGHPEGKSPRLPPARTKKEEEN